MTQQTLDRVLRQSLPDDWPGTLPEFLVFQELVRLGKTPDVDFTFQVAFQGGRLQKGGMILDFLFSDPPDLAINVQGTFFHGTAEQQSLDRIVRAQMAGQGITLIFIDEIDILADVRRFVRAALQYRDLSRLGR